jgi:hypothetical protein
MAHEPDRVMPGTFRREQNWIGGRPLNPSDANYVPPPEGDVESLILDLVDFMNRNAPDRARRAPVGGASRRVRDELPGHATAIDPFMVSGRGPS